MYVQKIRAHFLLEVMIMVGVIIIVMPITWQQINLIYQTNRTVLDTIKQATEGMERYYQLYIDGSKFKQSIGNCCFISSDHIICYDIKNGRFRRRKKQFESSRFHTTYLGATKDWLLCECQSTNQSVKIILSQKSSRQEYVFSIVQ